MTFVGGIDSGSTTTKLALLRGNEFLHSSVTATGANSQKAFRNVMAMAGTEIGSTDVMCLVATGYGRHNIDGAAKQVSEITCQAKAVNWLFPDAQLIVDIGGQDFKVIEIDKTGRVVNFAMNDKCAAGTGRYLELMANIFAMDLDEFGSAAGAGDKIVEITSFCSVFAETEVVSQISRGSDPQAIVAGIFSAVAKRVYGLAKRSLVGKKELVFTGGVAKNAGMIRALEDVFGIPVRVPPKPQVTGALGAALFAREHLQSATQS